MPQADYQSDSEISRFVQHANGAHTQCYAAIAIEFKTELERVLFRFAYLLCSVQITQITCFRYDMVHLHRPIFGSRFDSIGRAA